MTDDVSFYVIAILALRVKSHSLQESNVLGNVLIVDHHVKKCINKYIQKGFHIERYIDSIYTCYCPTCEKLGSTIIFFFVRLFVPICQLKK